MGFIKKSGTINWFIGKKGIGNNWKKRIEKYFCQRHLLQRRISHVTFGLISCNILIVHPSHNADNVTAFEGHSIVQFNQQYKRNNH